MYIALFDSGVYFIEETLIDLCCVIFQVEIKDNGTVLIGGKPDSISYDMAAFTKQEALHDFANTRMPKILPNTIRIYKAQLI